MNKFLCIAIPLFILSSCGKYEDGPGLSLRTKKDRITNAWQVSSAMQNGVDKTSDFNALFAGYLLDIRKDETYSLSYSPLSMGQVNETGRWEFVSDKLEIRFTNSDGESRTYQILRLKEKEFWIRFQQDDTDWEVHLVPKS
jgi:hypothetical protein